MAKAQKWLDEWYPKEGGCLREEIEDEYRKINNSGKTRSEITELNISEKDLVGDLKLEGFVNLENLICEENKLTSLKIVDSPKLKVLNCVKNELTNLDISTCPNLESLWCYSNLLTSLDLTQLKVLEISNTDLDSGLEYLPFSLQIFSCPADQREDEKVKKLETELKNFGEVGENEEFIHLLNAWRKVNCEFIFDTLQKTIEELKEKNAELEAELQMEREEAKKALEAAQRWREMQLAQKDEKITNLNENITQLESTLSTTKTLLVTAQNLASNQTKTEENLGWIKVIMVGGFLTLIGLQILFGIWILWGNKRNKKT